MIRHFKAFCGILQSRFPFHICRMEFGSTEKMPLIFRIKAFGTGKLRQKHQIKHRSVASVPQPVCNEKKGASASFGSHGIHMKKIISLLLTGLILCGLLTACNDQEQNSAGKVYYLNFKPEQDKQWKEVARKYTELTGVEVKILTAASGLYEQTLTSEIEKTDAPTLFQISGSVALNTWRNYCYDLSESKVYKELTSDDFAVRDGDAIYGIAYVYEGYGLIVNKALLKEAGYTVDEITDFAALKRIAEDITARSSALGFSAFTSSGLDNSSAWRFSGHLANIPLFYEFREDQVKAQPASIKGTYLDNYKALWDLYIGNATCQPSVLPSKTNDNAIAEFVNRQAVFYQNGTWSYSDISSVGDETIAYLPIYAGIDDEKQGLCCGTENYWAVNSQASKADIQATLDFLYWLVTSEYGTNALSHDMGFVSPFKSAKATDNVLSNDMNAYVAKGCYNVSWAFQYTPNVDAWRADLVSALAAYSAGTGDWSAVEKAFVDGWATQYRASHAE